jgi:hypothetical protein
MHILKQGSIYALFLNFDCRHTLTMYLSINWRRSLSIIILDIDFHNALSTKMDVIPIAFRFATV